MEDQFNNTRVFLALFRQLDGALRRFDGLQVYRAPLGFGDDLLGQDKDVVILERELAVSKCPDNNIRQVVISADPWNVEQRS
jgi:hypothetical protein